MSVKAGKEVIEALNDVLTAELTAINQYFVHAKILANLGFDVLAAKMREESIDEMKHAESIMDRILYLDGIPNVQRLGRIRVGETPREQFQSDMQLEHEAIPRLNIAIEKCREVGDNGTRALLEQILIDEEAHLDWLETQLSLIDSLGESTYLAEQLR